MLRDTCNNACIEPAKHIYIGPSSLEGAGRGVFAAALLPEGTLIEQCPVIPLQDPKDRDRLRKTGLVNYYFLWGEGRLRAALCLGWGSIYNHSYTPNARYEKLMEEGRMDFYALTDIAPGEEITVNYNGAPHDARAVRVPGVPGGPSTNLLVRLRDGCVRRFRLLFGKTQH